MSTDRNSARASARPTRRIKSAERSGSPRAARGMAAPGRPASRGAERPVRGDRSTGAPSRGRATAPGAPTRDALRDFVLGHRAPIIGVVVALAVVVALYGPACSLYQAWRDNGMLLSQQAQADEESARLEDDIESLMTEDGIKDEARERGYVESGEKRIVVEGLEGESSSDGAAVGSSETPWYLRATDFIFQYEAQS